MFSWPSEPTYLNEFPTSHWRPIDWLKNVETELQKLRQIISQSTAVNEIDCIDSYITNIRAPTVEELIHQNVISESEEWKKKLDIDTTHRKKRRRQRGPPETPGHDVSDSPRLQEEGQKETKTYGKTTSSSSPLTWQSYGIDIPIERYYLNRKIKKELNRYPTRIMMPDDTLPECGIQSMSTCEWSENRLLMKLRRETKLETYKLSHDFDYYRFKRVFVTYNSSSDPHGLVTRNLLETAKRQALSSSKGEQKTNVNAKEKITAVSSITSKTDPKDVPYSLTASHLSISQSRSLLSLDSSAEEIDPVLHNRSQLSLSDTPFDAVVSNSSGKAIASLAPSSSTKPSLVSTVIVPKPISPSLITPFVPGRTLAAVQRPQHTQGQQLVGWLVTNVTQANRSLLTASSRHRDEDSASGFQRSSIELSEGRSESKEASDPCLSSSLTQSSFKQVHDQNCSGEVLELLKPATEIQQLGDASELESNYLLNSDPSILPSLQPDEVIITVSFYHPVRGLKSAEFDILGSQTLADLKDAFICDEDLTFYSRRYPWSCFFIGGVFYSDDRNPGVPNYAMSVKYSNVLVPHILFSRRYRRLAEHLIKYAPSKVKRTNYRQSMESTVVGQICLPYNQRCAYLHRGDCEHRVIFTSIRKYDPLFDCPYREGYPLRVFEPATKITLCQACLLTQAEKTVFNSIQLPQNPTVLCSNCFDAFFKDSSGNFVTDEDFLHFEFRDTV